MTARSIVIEVEAHDVSRFEWLWQLLARERWRARPTILVHMLEQNAVKTTAFDLDINPASPGMS